MDHQTQIRLLHNLSLFIIGLLLGCILLSNCSGEDSKQPVDKSDSLIKANISLLDSIKILNDSVAHLDTTRVKTVIKYRYLKGRIDSIPCDTFVTKIIQICDTIIYNDSIEIMALKQINTHFAEIISNDNQIIINKNNEIDSLKNSKKKYWKGFKHGLIAGSIGTTLIFGSVITK